MVSQFLTLGGGGCVISILKILTGGGGGSKILKIRLTSFVHGPKGEGEKEARKGAELLSKATDG